MGGCRTRCLSIIQLMGNEKVSPSLKLETPLNKDHHASNHKKVPRMGKTSKARVLFEEMQWWSCFWLGWA